MRSTINRRTRAVSISTSCSLSWALCNTTISAYLVLHSNSSWQKGSPWLWGSRSCSGFQSADWNFKYPHGAINFAPLSPCQRRNLSISGYHRFCYRVMYAAFCNGCHGNFDGLGIPFGQRRLSWRRLRCCLLSAITYFCRACVSGYAEPQHTRNFRFQTSPLLPIL